MVTRSQKFKLKAPRPFRLVKFISFTGLGLILITTMVLSWVISNYAKRVMLDRSESYSLLLAEHVNRQVFLQFVHVPFLVVVKRSVRKQTYKHTAEYTKLTSCSDVEQSHGFFGQVKSSGIISMPYHSCASQVAQELLWGSIASFPG